MELSVLIVGGGMISEEVILPTCFQEQRRGRLGEIRVCTRRAATIAHLRQVFPRQDFIGFPDPAAGSPEESVPEGYRRAIADLPRPGVVIVATPDPLHTPVILAAIEAEHDVICEKPLCLKVDEALEIQERAREKGLYVLTDYHKRHDRAIRAVKYKFAQGELGEMLHGHAWIEERREIPLRHFVRWCEQSSPFEYIGVHYADAYYYITGLLPRRVVAFGQKKFLPKQGINAYDAIQATIEWRDGSVLFIQTSWVCSPHNSALTNQGLQLHGTEGEYWADHKDRNLHFVTQQHGFEHYNPNFFKAYPDWENPREVEYVGYGYESIQQGFDDIRQLWEETEGLDATDGLARRLEILDRWEKTRALPNQALIGTALNEAVRLSVAHDNRFVVFDDQLRPRLG